MARPDEPWRLRPDNFTPPTRTPWGGQRIKQLKKGLPLEKDYACIGESWEVSTDAAFPTLLADGTPLAQLVPDLRFLVKIVDAAEPLSVQVHPDDGYTGLRANECGKPEQWFIVDSDPGAGVYLGFRDGVKEADVRACIADKGPLDQLMHFIPVKARDVFNIGPGMVHAIGGGVTLVEPQGIAPGKSAVTYRFWDWNRQPARELHLEHSFAVARFERYKPSKMPFHAEWVSEPKASDRLTAVVVVQGEVVVAEQWRFRAGESFILPPKLPGRIHAQDALCVTVRM